MIHEKWQKLIAFGISLVMQSKKNGIWNVHVMYRWSSGRSGVKQGDLLGPLLIT